MEGGMHIALGITGCIAAYKAALIVRELQKRGINKISVIMTDSATRFITPLTFEALTSNRVITGMWEPVESREITHISLARSADLLLVAPATADIIGKFANGIADDFLSTFYLAFEKQVVAAPAMNKEMWGHKQVQTNIKKIEDAGVRIVLPGKGYLACGEEGEGRLADIGTIVEAVFDALEPSKKLLGKRFLITAGPTREPIDDVRFISNPSTGKMGYAVAEEAARMGAEVKLISGPVQLDAPKDVSVIRVNSASEMANAVKHNIKSTDVLVMAAAVGDFKPKTAAKGKMKKESVPMTLELEQTEDILSSIKESSIFKVGFAAEIGGAEEKARGKMIRKGLDIIVANDVSEEGSGFGTDTNRITVLNKDGSSERLGLMTKNEAAQRLLEYIIKNLPGKDRSGKKTR
jgi:phosphopantothenoylcysteine decarboxylase/phosphopantothenate--cysteine ligase